MNSLTLALVGCGKMGGALLQGWLDNPLISRITVVEPHELPPQFTTHNKIFHIKTVAELNGCDIVLLAVKPQVMDALCGALKTKLADNTVVVSIAAGKTLGFFEKHFGIAQPVIRIMPNLPASIGQGISVAIASKNVNAVQKKYAAALFEATGVFEWIENEGLMDAVTATSGSGPAYVFLLIEALAKAAEKQGLELNFALRLARQTVIGSAALAQEDAQTPISTLRENVTSPGGTTEAALKILLSGEMQELFDQAIEAATRRGQELSS